MCACSDLHLLRCCGDIVQVVLGVMQQPCAQSQLHASDRQGSVAAARYCTRERISAACSSASESGRCDARVLRRADEAAAAILCMVAAEAIVCARHHTCDSERHAHPCCGCECVVANLCHSPWLRGCCTVDTMSRRARDRLLEISMAGTKRIHCTEWFTARGALTISFPLRQTH